MEQPSIDPVEYARFISERESLQPPCTVLPKQARVYILATSETTQVELSASMLSVHAAQPSIPVSIVAEHRVLIPQNIPSSLQWTQVDGESLSIPVLLNRCLSEQEEEYAMLLPAGDQLACGSMTGLAALTAMPFSLRNRVAAMVLDDDEVNETGQRINPRFKPGYSPDYLLETDYVGYAVWFSREKIIALGGFDPQFSHEYIRDALLRLDEAGWVIEKTDAVGVHHQYVDQRRFYPQEQIQLIRETAQRRGMKLSTVEQLAYGVRPKYATNNALASIIIPFRDHVELLQPCVESILQRTTYLQYEIILLNNQSTQIETLAYLDTLRDHPRIRQVDYNHPFNYSKGNNFAVGHARGDVLVFLNNDTQVIAPEWLEELVGDALQPGVGAVGSKLYFANGTIQHAGVVIGLTNTAGHILAGEDETLAPPEYVRYRRNCCAVTAACMAIPRKVYAQAGGFDERFEVAGNDVELCLRIRDYGYRIVFNPAVRLYHYDQGSRKDIPRKDIDMDLSICHYQPYLDDGDPYFNQQLSPNSSRPVLNFGEEPLHRLCRQWYRDEKAAKDSAKLRLTWVPREPDPNSKLPDDEVIAYDVTPEILAANRELLLRFYRKPYLELNRAIWFMPFIEHILRGGVYTILRTANYFSERAGTHNIFVFFGHRHTSIEQTALEIRNVFPAMKFELLEFWPPANNIHDLPEADAAFSTLWTSAYHLVRYNKCKCKFNFLQDYEPSFYAAGTRFGLIEETYRFGFAAVANTPGVAESYRPYTQWVDYFIPAVDRNVFYPTPDKPKNPNRFRIFFYGRPNNERNAFRLGIESLREVKKLYGDRVEIISAGCDFSLQEYHLEGVLENYGLMGNLNDIAALYRSCDIGLVFMFSAHPSYQPFEFMASGCVTVTNDNPSNRWFLKEGVNTVLTEPVIGCVTSTIIDLLEDPERRERIREGGLKTVAKLDWDTALERIHRFVTHPVSVTPEELARIPLDIIG